MELAKPQVRAQIAASMSAGRASDQSVKESTERLTQLQAVGAQAIILRGLQAKLAGAKTDAERSALEQEITDNGYTGKDLKGFLAIAEKAMTNGDSAMKVLMDPMADPENKEAARKLLDRAIYFADQAAAKAGIKPQPEKPPSIPQGAIDDLKKKPSLRAAFEAKFKVSADQYLKGAVEANPPAPNKGIIESAVAPAAERNPFVDKTGRVIPGSSAQGADSLLNTTILPAAGQAVDSIGTAMNEQYKRSLQMKIERGEALSQGEQIRARQLGLMK